MRQDLARYESTIDSLGITSSRGRTVNLDRILRFVQFTILFVHSFTSKIVLTREDDQVHIGNYAQHVFTRED